MNVDTIDISTKDSAGYRDILGGQKSFSLSADGLMDFAGVAADTEVDELFTQMFVRTDSISVVLQFSLLALMLHYCWRY